MRGKVTSEVSQARRSRILQMCSREPHTSRAICAALGLPMRGADHYIYTLADAGHLVKSGSGKDTVWMTPTLHRNLNRCVDRRPDAAAMDTPVVTIPERPEYTMPAVEVTWLGPVKITRQPAPRGRFEADITPGTGVISQDWAADRGVRISECEA